MSQRAVDELTAVLAIAGQDALLQVQPEALRPALLEGSYDASSFSELQGKALSVTLQVTSPTVLATDHEDLEEVSSSGQTGTTAQHERAQLHLMLPPSYPEGGQAAQALVTCGSRRRDWEAACSEALQQTADDAAASGREVIYDLVQALQSALAAQPRQQAASSPSAEVPGRRKVSVRRPAAAAAGQSAGSPGQVSVAHSVMLLRLDHMRDRSSYTKLIKAWAAELQLTGRLLFLGPIILIVLEGSPEGLKEYLFRKRTQNVDVDSKGRPCKERMLSVVCEEPRPAGRAFAEFAEQELGSMQQLQEVLGQARLQDWAQAATGLPASTA